MRNKKSSVIILTILFLIVTVTCAAYAGKKEMNIKPPKTTFDRNIQNMVRPPRPDLIVTDIKAKDDPKGCFLQVTLKNNGPGKIPETYYHKPPRVAIQMYNGNNPWGGIVLFGFDPYKKVQNPGGMATWDWFPGAQNLRLHPGYYTIKVVADSNHELAEANENNNSLARKVSCGCNVRLPKPVIRYSNRDSKGRVYIPVVNWASFPNELFQPAPYLPPCGLNKNSSRTWVNIYDAQTNQRLYGFCALGHSKNLQGIWFMPPSNAKVKAVYVEIKDRACGRSQRSNVVNISKSMGMVKIR